MENNVPDFQKVMYPALDYLRDGQPHSMSDVMEGLTKHFNPPSGASVPHLTY